MIAFTFAILRSSPAESITWPISTLLMGPWNNICYSSILSQLFGTDTLPHLGFSGALPLWLKPVISISSRYTHAWGFPNYPQSFGIWWGLMKHQMEGVYTEKHSLCTAQWKLVIKALSFWRKAYMICLLARQFWGRASASKRLWNNILCFKANIYQLISITRILQMLSSSWSLKAINS